MAEELMWANIGVAATVVAIAATLLAVYLRSYQKLRAPYTVGLAVFAGVFVVQGLFLAIGGWFMIPFVVGPLAPYLLATALFEVGGLGALFLVTYR